MAAQGYEFYLRVLKVSRGRVRDSKNRKIVQLKWSPSQNACHKNVLKLGYKVIKEK